jgi:ParB family chromosome partitioning protein
MKSSSTAILVSLSKLIPARKNVRRVKPEREAHRRLVASIRAHGLLEPLVVQQLENGQFSVIAGSRRLAALREVYKGTKTEAKIPCQLREADEATAEALSLAENFVREAMHPMDEAQVFAKLAGEEGKNAEQIATDFGTSAGYVRLCKQPHNLTYELSLLMWPDGDEGSG